MNYFVRIKDEHVDHAFRQVVDALNQLRDNSATKQQVATVAASVPSLPQLQQQLQAGGSVPLNLTGLPGAPGVTTVGTHAQRLATPPTVGTFFIETDRTVLYVGETVSSATAWVYVAGVMYAAFAGRPTDLGANDVGFLYVPSEHLHWCSWQGSAWKIIDDDGGTFKESVRALGTGYQLCDGSATSYLTISGADLAQTSFTTADENGGAAGVYHKSIAAYTGTINAATAPGATSSALTFTGTPGTTGNDSASVEVQAGTGTTVAADPHTHGFTPAGTINTPTITVDAAGQPRNLGVLRYFRR